MFARLHHERIVRTGATPSRWLLMTHGIFGSGANWRGIARKIHEARPEWGVVLADLRGHGRSERGEPPQTLAACADDVRMLATELGGVDALAGHSFGGKVVLVARSLVRVRQTWVLDASPSARPDLARDTASSVAGALALLERLPPTWAHRDDFIAAVVAEGNAMPFAQWLAMNVIPDASGRLTLRLDLAQMRALLADYYAQDLWASLDDPSRGEVELVLADRASAVSPSDRARLQTAPPHVHVERVDAGHWLHIDAPAAVVELFAHRLP
jgi:pimeloyl-ACP methyl ester carboxylesterase